MCVCIHGFTSQRKILDIIFQALSFVLDRVALWSGHWQRRLDQLAYRDSPALPPISLLLVQKYMPLNPLFYTESGDLKSGHQCLWSFTNWAIYPSPLFYLFLFLQDRVSLCSLASHGHYIDQDGLELIDTPCLSNSGIKSMYHYAWLLWNMILLCSTSWPRTYYVNQTSLKRFQSSYFNLPSANVEIPVMNHHN